MRKPRYCCWEGARSQRARQKVQLLGLSREARQARRPAAQQDRGQREQGCPGRSVKAWREARGRQLEEP
jgi:hypothetical protein